MAQEISQAIVQNGLELKKYKEAVGHEGPAFSCEVWHRGKKAVLVTNSGEGGCNSYWEYEHGIVDLLIEIGRMEQGSKPEDRTIVEMLVMVDRKKQAARWAKKGLTFAAEVVIRAADWTAIPPVWEDDVKMCASSTESGLVSGLAKEKFVRARRINPDGSLGAEFESYRVQ